MDEPVLNEEMRAILEFLEQNGPQQFPALVNGVLGKLGRTVATGLDRQIVFHDLQQLIGFGLVVYGADWQRPEWPWLNLTDRAREVITRKPFQRG